MKCRLSSYMVSIYESDKIFNNYAIGKGSPVKKREKEKTITHVV